MMKFLVSLVIFIAFVYPSFSQTDAEKALSKMIETEKSFAAKSKSTSMKEAFVEYLTDSTIMFVKGEFTPGKPYYQALPVTDQLLFWWPKYVGISASHDFAFSIGPYVWAPKKTDEPVSFGHYFTIWERSKEGIWRMTFDTGISHEKSTNNEDSVLVKIYPETITKQKATKDFGKFISEYDQLLNQEVRTVEPSILASNYILLREGIVPILKGGKIQNEHINEKFTTLAYKVSSSSDLGYSYGVAKGESLTSWKYFARVWRKEKGEWKLLVDLLNNYEIKQ